MDALGPDTSLQRALVARPGLVVVATSDRDTERPSHLYLSTDSTHWHDVTPQAALTPFRASPVAKLLSYQQFSAASFTDSQRGWVVACNYADSRLVDYHTNDGGHTWTASLGGGIHCDESVQAIGPGVAIRSDPANRGGGGVGYSTIGITSDDGHTWRPLWTIPDGTSTGPYNTPVRFVNATVGFSSSLIGSTAADDGWPPSYFISTNDGGLTWTTHRPPAPSGTSAQYDLPTFHDPMHGVLPVVGVGSSNVTLGFDETADGGATWTAVAAVPLPLQLTVPARGPESFSQDLNVDVSSPETWWIAAPTGGGNRIITTSDRGRSWLYRTPVGLSALPTDIHGFDATRAVATVFETVGSPGSLNYRSAVYMTSDAGADWVALDPTRRVPDQS